MKWHRFWVKGSKNGVDEKNSSKSIDVEALDMDFFCHLSYMAAIATSGISRSRLFEQASKLPYISARYFKKIDFVAKAFDRDYAEACNIVGQTTEEPEVKALLLRLSGAMSSGEDIPTFLEKESDVFSESYSSRYEQRLELLKKWTDAYIALIMTSAIVTVMSVVTMMIGNITIGFIITMSLLTILITIIGAWLIYHTAPREIKIHSLPCRSIEQNLVRNLAKIMLPIGGITVLFMLVMRIDLGWSLLVASAFIFPLGLITNIDDRKVDKRDTDIASFLRSLGGVSQAIGTTVNEAIGRLDFRSLGYLKEQVSLLYTRLLAGIDPHRCWEQLAGESGSEQVNRSVRIFWDGVTLGGNPQLVGNDASSFAMKIALLRSKRQLIATGNTWLTIAMHIVLTILIIFIYQTLIAFADLVMPMMPDTETIQSLPMVLSTGVFSTDSVEVNLLHFMVIVIILVLTLANAFAIYAASGGHIYKLTYYLAMTMAISGAAIVFVPAIVNTMFSGII